MSKFGDFEKVLTDQDIPSTFTNNPDKISVPFNDLTETQIEFVRVQAKNAFGLKGTMSFTD